LQNEPLRLFHVISVFIIIASALLPRLVTAQTQFSLATDMNLVRSFKEDQEFWNIGQTVSGQFHFTPKDGAYIWLAYTSDGRFMRRYEATAKDPNANPQTISFINRSRISYRHLSMGWKHYLLGRANKEVGGSLYAYAGFGLMMGRASNTFIDGIDTSNYTVPVLPGKGNFKRLTGDLGIGYDWQVGGDIFLYLESRALVPISDYPTGYILNSKYAPLTGSLNFGVRILFE
jgi:hypothetical protein